MGPFSPLDRYSDQREAIIGHLARRGDWQMMTVAFDDRCPSRAAPDLCVHTPHQSLKHEKADAPG